MSGSNDKDTQSKSATESNCIGVGDVLAKEFNDDTFRDESTDSEDELRLEDQRQEADGAPEFPDFFPQSTFTQSALMDCQVDEHSWNTQRSDDDSENEELLSVVGPMCASKHVEYADNKTHGICDICTPQRVLLRDKVSKVWRWQSQGLKLKQYIRSVFNAAIESPCVPNIQKHEVDPVEYAELQEIVTELVNKHPHKFFLMLVIQAHEFVVELKILIMRPLIDMDLAWIAEIFLTRLLNGYDKLVATAVQVSELIKPLEEKHLSKFNLTWEFFNKKLYQNYIYFYEPTIRNILPSVVGQLRKPRRGKGYQVLLERYLGFVDEMMKIAGMWPEKELMIDKFSAEQVLRIMKNCKHIDNWAVWSRTEAERIDNERTMDVPGLGLNRMLLEPYAIKWLDRMEYTPDMESVRKMLDEWSREAYTALAQSFLGLNSYEPSESTILRSSGYYFGYQVATWLVLSRPSDSSMEVDTECTVCQDTAWVSHLVVGGRTNSGGCAHPTLKSIGDIKLTLTDDPTSVGDKTSKRCLCTFHHLGEWQGAAMRGLLSFPPCLCMLNMRQHSESSCPCVRENTLRKKKRLKLETCSNTSQNELADSSMQSLLLKTESSSAEIRKLNLPKVDSAPIQTRHCTTQTPTSALHHNQNHQGRCPTHSHTHGPPNENAKGNATPSHKASHNHNNHQSHGCHKQTSILLSSLTSATTMTTTTMTTTTTTTTTTITTTTTTSTTSTSTMTAAPTTNVEQTRRLTCINTSLVDGNCSDSGSNEDSCSTEDSSSPRDNNRHCDCCYCEVFGHGVPSVAPVSRNYNETRERLRQLLTKKKAKKCKTACSPSVSPAESVPSGVNSDNNSLPMNSRARSNTPISNASTVLIDQSDDRDLDKLLEFIEGNQPGSNNKKHNKKNEKKARQKQKKLDEAMKKQQEEMDRQKLIEIQKKTPEVTITVVDPQKPIAQKLHLNRNLPEVSILPTVSPVQPKQIINVNNSKKNNKHSTVAVKDNSKCSKENNIHAIGIDEVTNANSLKKDSQKGTNKGKNNKINLKVSKQLPVSIIPPMVTKVQREVPLTKKERKKLRREMKKLEETKAKDQPKPQLTENQPQIVTIKRVMESNSAEPTVTITLKGQTPAEDKVLFTLVNGQTKEPIKDQQSVQISTSKKKKKKNQGDNINSRTNNQPQINSASVKTQQNSVLKGQSTKTNEKGQKQSGTHEKSKTANKNVEEKKNQSQSSAEIKITKLSKKDKKNAENKQPMQDHQPLQINNVVKSKNQQQEVKSGKKNKSNIIVQPLAEIKFPLTLNNVNELSGKKAKGKIKLQQQQQLQLQQLYLQQQQQQQLLLQQQHQQQQQLLHQHQQKLQEKNNQSGKSKKNNKQALKVDGKKNLSTINQQSKQQMHVEEKNSSILQNQSISSQILEANSKINIKDLKLPPGITITKVDVPTKSFPIKSTPLQKAVEIEPPKQATIIAAPMTGLRSNYSSSQSGGNVIVVDTGKLKQELLPTNENDVPKEQTVINTTSGKKKKKKNNTSANINNNTNNSAVQKNVNNSTKEQNEQAKILHNPGSNMVTIRNPAFGSAPKMEPLQQAAIIKLSENGMVTIRSPALQQAINAGLTPPSKPDFIVKGEYMTANTSKTATITSTNSTGTKCANDIISPSLTELRSRLTPDGTGLTGLANIQISKVTNGQPIPENGINLKGTSVTLTKVRNPADNVTSVLKNDDNQFNTATSKGKKKKKRGNGARPSGDDWNLVESVFTPKDIDLEDGEMDDAERELEAFKRFCLQSVPPPRKEKVNLNIKDIVLKKKSSSAAPIIAAN